MNRKAEIFAYFLIIQLQDLTKILVLIMKHFRYYKARIAAAFFRALFDLFLLFYSLN